MTRKSIMVDVKETEEHNLFEKASEFNDRAFLRFFYKPCDGGTVWAYNQKTLNLRCWSEIPSPNDVGATQLNDMISHSQQTREAEEDEENNVDL